MNSLIKQLVRRLPDNLRCLSKQHHHTHSSLSRFVINTQPFIQNENNISQLIQRNVIPLTDILPRASILDQPCTNIIRKIDTPVLQKIEDKPRKNMHDPESGTEKKAHTMLRIKRKKMNRHKYEKRQRKLRNYYMSIRRVRYAKRENAFRAEIGAKLKELEKFDPAEYVESRLKLFRQVILPNRIKGGVRMPPFVILEQIEKRRQLEQERADAKERKRQFMIENGGTLDVKG